jgi:hypothetical protein
MSIRILPGDDRDWQEIVNSLVIPSAQNENCETIVLA